MEANIRDGLKSRSENWRLWLNLLTAAGMLLASGCSRPSDISDRAAGTGEIRAEPNPVPSGEGVGKTTISWKSDIDISEVAVSVNGADEQVFSPSPSKQGSAIAAWIPDGSTEFRLYSGPQHNKILARVTVTRQASDGSKSSITPAPVSSPP